MFLLLFNYCHFNWGKWQHLAALKKVKYCIVGHSYCLNGRLLGILIRHRLVYKLYCGVPNHFHNIVKWSTWKCLCITRSCVWFEEIKFLKFCTVSRSGVSTLWQLEGRWLPIPFFVALRYPWAYSLQTDHILLFCGVKGVHTHSLNSLSQSPA